MKNGEVIVTKAGITVWVGDYGVFLSHKQFKQMSKAQDAKER